jgi:F-type H+-transporting ATPase subunit b
MELVSPGIGLIFWMTLSFLLVVWLLGRFAWRPIMRGLREREHSIQEALNAADKAREEMKALHFSNEALLQEAKDERDAILKEGRKIREKMLEDARIRGNEESERIITAARESIHYEKMAAITELKNQVAKLSIDIASNILKEELKDKVRYEAYARKELENLKLS